MSKAAVIATQMTSIANAVRRMEHIMEGGNPRSSIRGEALAEIKHIQHIVEKMGGMMWVNEWHGDVALRDIAVPEDWRNIRGGVSVRSWPDAKSGSIVEHDGRRWTVAVNFAHGGVSGRYTEVFSVYAIIPA